jgi:hypothetical protein
MIFGVGGPDTITLPNSEGETLPLQPVMAA